jgi:hypothetical protein
MYFDVRQYITDKLGNSYPLFLTSFEPTAGTEFGSPQFIQELDSKFKSTSNKYELSLNQLQQNIQATQKELMEAFSLNNQNNLNIATNIHQNNSSNNDDDDFSFGAFT